jgi:hypothetical protein
MNDYLPILEYFEYAHLPNENLKRISKLFADLVDELQKEFPQPSGEYVAGLRKILEAKDCMVRAKVTQLKKSTNDDQS